MENNNPSPAEFVADLKSAFPELKNSSDFDALKFAYQSYGAPAGVSFNDYVKTKLGPNADLDFSPVESGLRGAANGATLDALPYIAAGVNKARGYISGDDKPFNDLLTMQRLKNGASADQNPMSDTGGRIAGTLAAAVAAPEALGVDSVLGRGAVNASIGGIQSGLDALNNNAPDAGSRALQGAGIGALLTGVGAGAGKIVNAAGKALNAGADSVGAWGGNAGLTGNADELISKISDITANPKNPFNQTAKDALLNHLPSLAEDDPKAMAAIRKLVSDPKSFANGTIEDLTRSLLATAPSDMQAKFATGVANDLSKGAIDFGAMPQKIANADAAERSSLLDKIKEMATTGLADGLDLASDMTRKVTSNIASDFKGLPGLAAKGGQWAIDQVVPDITDGLRSMIGKGAPIPPELAGASPQDLKAVMMAKGLDIPTTNPISQNGANVAANAMNAIGTPLVAATDNNAASQMGMRFADWLGSKANGNVAATPADLAARGINPGSLAPNGVSPVAPLFGNLGGMLQRTASAAPLVGSIQTLDQSANQTINHAQMTNPALAATLQRAYQRGPDYYKAMLFTAMQDPKLAKDLGKSNVPGVKQDDD